MDTLLDQYLMINTKIQYMIGNIDIMVKELCKLPGEIGWAEIKHNNYEPNMIGEDISALANTATLNGGDYAYMIWGVDDTTHEIIGTKVRLQMKKKVIELGVNENSITTLKWE